MKSEIRHKLEQKKSPNIVSLISHIFVSRSSGAISSLIKLNTKPTTLLETGRLCER